MKDGRKLAREYLEQKGVMIDSVHDGVYDISDNPFQLLSTSVCENEDEREAKIKSRVDFYRERKCSEEQLATLAKELKAAMLLEADFIASLDGIIAACQDNVCYSGRAYERDDEFLFARKPEKAKYKQFGDGFEGHGTSVILQFEQPPKAILILGQND